MGNACLSRPSPPKSPSKRVKRSSSSPLPVQEWWRITASRKSPSPAQLLYWRPACPSYTMTPVIDSSLRPACNITLTSLLLNRSLAATKGSRRCGELLACHDCFLSSFRVSATRWASCTGSTSFSMERIFNSGSIMKVHLFDMLITGIFVP
jgi:hypothetical protein